MDTPEVPGPVRFEMIIGDITEWVSLGEAGRMYDSGLAPVRIGSRVKEAGSFFDKKPPIRKPHSSSLCGSLEDRDSRHPSFSRRHLYR